MTNQTKGFAISLKEEARRRNVVASANWSAEMEGFGKQTLEYNALSELWITGKITYDELMKCQMSIVSERINMNNGTFLLGD